MIGEATSPEGQPTQTANPTHHEPNGEQPAGDGPLTFDELESLDEGQAKERGKTLGRQPKEKEDDKKAGKVSEIKPDSQEVKDQKKEQVKKDASKKEGEKPEGEKSEAPIKEGEGEAEGEKPPVKTLKVQVGEETQELPEDAAVSVKINGQEEQVSLSELRNNYSGKTVWEKKFNELDKERRSFKQEKQRAESIVQEVVDKAQDDPEMAHYLLMEKFGHDPIEYRKKLYENLIPSLEKYSQMSDADRKAMDLEFENKLLKHRNESAQQEKDSEKAYRELSSKVQELQEAHSISENDWLSRYDELVEYQKAGKLPKDTEITPDFVAETVVKDRMWNEMASQLQELGRAEEEGVNNKLMELCNLGYEQKLAPSDMRDIIKDVYSDSSSAKKISEKARQAEIDKGSREPGGKAPSSPKNPSAEPVLFDDLDG